MSEQRGLTKELMALRAAKELKDGMYVNLGVGLPTLVGNFLPPGMDIFLHSENGILGYGEMVTDEQQMDVDLINAGGQPVTLVPGACFFDFATSFGMIRGGHLDVSILGAYQVSEKGALANLRLPGEGPGAIGGAIELACGAKQVFVIMEHTAPSGKPKLVRECTLPLTGKGVVNMVFTNLAVIRITHEGLIMEEIAPGLAIEEVQKCTEPKLIISPALKEIEL